MDSPWIWQFPSKLAGTPKKSAQAFGTIFEEVTVDARGPCQAVCAVLAAGGAADTHGC